MEEVDGPNFEMELRSVLSNLTNNGNTLQRFLNSCKMDVVATCKNLTTKILSTQEERQKVKQRIEELRRGIQQCEANHTQEREGVKQLKRELEKSTLLLQRKEEELETQKEILAECVEKTKKEEMVASDAKQDNQRKMSQADSSIQLFKTHLGLDIACVCNTLILRFTQVSHSNPEAEYMVKMSLEGDNYTLLGSEPPLPSLPHLQEELNASGNLLACIVQIRKLFEQMDSKRPRE